MNIATWNVNSLRPRIDQAVRFAEDFAPDVLCLQETKVTDPLFPHAELLAAGFTHRAIHGQKTYNGVAILSRFPLEDVKLGFSLGEPDPQARLIRATVNGIRIVNCYVPNGNPIDTDKYTYKLDWYQRLRAELDAEASGSDDVLVCGDMNVAPGDADVHDPFEAEGRILFSEPEKAALDHLLAFGLTDVWRLKHPYSAEYSWWDYRGGGFQRNRGYRIDHVFLTASLLARASACEILRTPRTWERPSDHTPVMVTVDL